jgi:hypothetical protein
MRNNINNDCVRNNINNDHAVLSVSHGIPSAELLTVTLSTKLFDEDSCRTEIELATLDAIGNSAVIQNTPLRLYRLRLHPRRLLL